MVSNTLTETQRTTLVQIYNNRGEELTGTRLTTARNLETLGLLRGTNNPRLYKFTTAGSNIARRLARS
jgi:hypothetical protein